MFIFNRSFWAVGAGIATACALVAASFFLNPTPSLPSGNGPASVHDEAARPIHPAS